ncbi:MAG TPA: hypothetical protein VGK19_01865 [Capsulimonadaceae bacterium]|jgi:hypothetical protein
MDERTEQICREHPDEANIEPRWPALMAVLAIGGLYLAIPPQLALGPRWLPLLIIGILMVPTIFTHRRGYYTANHVLGIAVSCVNTVFMLVSLGLLLHGLVHGAEKPAQMLRSAVALWTTNVLVFAVWYWRLDAGGPHIRDRFVGHHRGSFLFPQMTMSSEELERQGMSGWSPGFVDYLFLAFNTSTALSPADTAVLEPWAKILCMVQSAISLSVIAFIAARAVNIL